MGDALEKKQGKYTIEEYIKLQEQSGERLEYHDGEIFAMAGGSRNHNRIQRSTADHLEDLLKDEGCEAFISEIRTSVHQSSHYLYPDIIVTCGEIDENELVSHVVDNPVIIAEVLSSSTRGYDLGKKLDHYSSIQSLHTYIAIEQDEPKVYVFERTSSGIFDRRWIEGTSEKIHLNHLNVELSLESIYSRMDFKNVLG